MQRERGALFNTIETCVHASGCNVEAEAKPEAKLTTDLATLILMMMAIMKVLQQKLHCLRCANPVTQNRAATPLLLSN